MACQTVETREYKVECSTYMEVVKGNCSRKVCRTETAWEERVVEELECEDKEVVEECNMMVVEPDCYINAGSSKPGRGQSVSSSSLDINQVSKRTVSKLFH